MHLAPKGAVGAQGAQVLLRSLVSLVSPSFPCAVVKAQGELSHRQTQSCSGAGRALGVWGKGLSQELKQSTEN